MPKSKYQRPEVYAYGKREKLWRGEYRLYFIGPDGKEHAKHKSKSWSRARYTKAQAQAELDKLLREQLQGGPRRDGSMLLRDFWDQIYYPVKAGKWALNSRRQSAYVWRKHIEPTLGAKRLNEIVKSDIDLLLLKLANAKCGEDLVSSVLKRVHAVFEEAVDNEFIPRNPARKIEPPTCKPKPEVRGLSVEEIQTLWDKTEGRDYLIWRVLVLTGARIGEALALSRSDLMPQGLLIDESALDGRASTTKSKKTRLVPIPSTLRAELEDWLKTHEHPLIFHTPWGRMHRRSDIHMQAVIERAREATGIADLKFKMCRTTFGTLIEGDVADTQAMMGHHSAAVTLKFYKKAVPLRQQEAVDALDARLNVVPIRRKA